MRIATPVCRILMGAVFVVFGANGFLHFIPQPPLTGLAADYFRVMFGSGYILPAYALQFVGGILLLVNRYVPLALALLAPIIVNVLLFHLTMQPAGLPPGLIVTVCWFVVAYRVRSAFAGIFVSSGAV